MSIPELQVRVSYFSADAAAYQINRSLRFNDNDGAKLMKTFSSAGNQKNGLGVRG